MLINMKDLEGVTVRASDGDIGHVEECYFDDRHWTVRYLVVDTGGWMGHRVLISPIAVSHSDLEAQTVHVTLTREQVSGSPRPESNRPVSRQYEERYFGYYAYAPYWGGAGYWGAGAYPAALATTRIPDADVVSSARATSDGQTSHLRSSAEVTGYHLMATDGEIGHVDDFILDDEHWTIRYLRIDTSNWIGGRAVLLPREAVDEVRWPERRLLVNRSKEDVRNSPPYDPSAFNRDYEAELARYYDRPF